MDTPVPYTKEHTQRLKWSEEHVRNLKEGKLVWLVGDSVKIFEYKAEQNIEIFTGNDSVVRSVIVQMALGELNRPVVKLPPVLSDGVSQIENRDCDVGATSN